MENKRVWPRLRTDFFETLCGNVHTRLKKLKDGLYDWYYPSTGGTCKDWG